MENMSGMRHIFISSTFRDMQAERDLVQELVLPSLRAECEKYSENVEFTDLRWGVDTTEISPEEGAKKVLRVCFDEIDKCDPHMLIFVGARYGWIPEETIIAQAIAGREELFGNGNLQQSVTALEIEYGTLASRRHNMEKSIVCFRMEEALAGIGEEDLGVYREDSALQQEKLQELKGKLQEKYGDKIIYYTASWDKTGHKLTNFVTMEGQPLAETLVARFVEIFAPDWQAYANISREERELRRNLAIRDKYVNRYVYQEADFAKLLAQVTDSDESSHILLEKINGTVEPLDGDLKKAAHMQIGAGLTATMSALSERLSKEGYGSAVFYCGKTAETSNLQELMETILFFLQKEANLTLEKKREDFVYEKQYLEYVVQEAVKEKNFYLFIDCIDSIALQSELQNLTFLPDALPGFKLILTGNLRLYLDQSRLADFEIVELFSINEETRTAMLDMKYKAVVQAIRQKQCAFQPLYLNLVNLRLHMLGFDELYHALSEEDIIRVATDAVEELPDHPLEAGVYLIHLAEQKLGVDSEDMDLALHLLALSECGLRVQDLQALMKKMGRNFSTLDFSILQKYLRGILYEDANGFVQFEQLLMTDQLREEFTHDMEKFKPMVAAYLEYLMELPAEDYLFRKMSYVIIMYSFDMNLAGKMYTAAGKNHDSLILSQIRACFLFDQGRSVNYYLDYVTNHPGEMNEDILRFFSTDFVLSFSELDEGMLSFYSEKLETMFKMVEYYYAVAHGESDYDLFKKKGAPQEQLDAILKAEAQVRKFLVGVHLPENARTAYVDFYQNMAVRKSKQGQGKEAGEFTQRALVTAQIKQETQSGGRSVKQFLLEGPSLRQAIREMIASGENEQAMKTYEGVINEAEALIQQEHTEEECTADELVNLFLTQVMFYSDYLELCAKNKQNKKAEAAFCFIQETWNALEERERKDLRPVWANANQSMFGMRFEQKRMEEAWSHLQASIEAYQTAYAYGNQNISIRTELAYVLCLAGEFYQKQKDGQRAISYYKQSLDLYDGLFRDELDQVSLADLSATAYKLWNAYMELGDFVNGASYAKTYASCKEAGLEMDRKEGGSNLKALYKDWMDALKLVSTCYKYANLQDEYIESLEKLIEASDKCIADTGNTSIIPIMDNYYVKIANVNIARGEEEKNIEVYHRLERFREKVFSMQATEGNLQNVAESKNLLSWLYKKLGKTYEHILYAEKEQAVAAQLYQMKPKDMYAQNVLGTVQEMLPASEQLMEMAMEDQYTQEQLLDCFYIRTVMLHRAYKILKAEDFVSMIQDSGEAYLGLLTVLRVMNFGGHREEEEMVRKILTGIS